MFLTAKVNKFFDAKKKKGKICMPPFGGKKKMKRLKYEKKAPIHIAFA